MFLLLILSVWEAIASLSSYYPNNQAGSLESGGKERKVSCPIGNQEGHVGTVAELDVRYPELYIKQFLKPSLMGRAM